MDKLELKLVKALKRAGKDSVKFDAEFGWTLNDNDYYEDIHDLINAIEYYYPTAYDTMEVDTYYMINGNAMAVKKHNGDVIIILRRSGDVIVKTPKQAKEQIETAIKV